MRPILRTLLIIIAILFITMFVKVGNTYAGEYYQDQMREEIKMEEFNRK